jgi:hypothetical protein
VAVASEAPAAEGFWSRVAVEVRLLGDHALSGSLLLETGAGDRLSDAVRAAEPWLILEAPWAVVWIAKSHLLTLEPAGS